MGVKKQRCMIKTFLHLNAKGIQVLTNRAAWDKIVAENLRNPLKFIIGQKAKEGSSIRNETDRDFKRLVAEVAPPWQVVLQTVGKINTPEVTDKFEFHGIVLSNLKLVIGNLLTRNPEYDEYLGTYLDYPKAFRFWSVTARHEPVGRRKLTSSLGMTA